MSRLEEELALQLRVFRLPAEREFRFHPSRKWRFDFAFPARKLAIEVEGGTWVSGRHTRGEGFELDCEKYAEAAALGWRVIRVTGRHIRDGRALGWVERALGE